jgi:glyceraldehyde 3-phosphate dehydrogenase
LAYLLKYDSVHGRFNGTVEVVDGKLFVNGKIFALQLRETPDLKWNEVDVVAECTGFTTIETATEHIKGGAKSNYFCAFC